MRRFRRSLLLASMLAAAPLTLIASAPASAQFSVSIGFDSFHGQLASYGDWLYSDRWGEVWRPGSQDRDRDWRPYWAGHWAFTDEYGWTWISDEGAWGDIAYHYGRWVFDPDDGWLWLPGYVWSPAWVVWRSSGDDVGWMPMPPDDDFLRPSGISIGVSFGDWNDIGGYYGYSRWYGSRFDENRFGNLWVFVPGGRLADRSYRRYALARPQTINIVRQSRNITNYTVVNNTIINRSVNVNVVRGPNGRVPQAVRANTVLRNNRWIAPVNQGEQIQQRARQERPHGNGLADSAPPPNRQQIQSLSTRTIPVRTENNAPGNAPNNAANNDRGNRRGGGLFNRNTVEQFAARRQAQPNTQPSAAPQALQPPQQPQAQQPNPPPQTPSRDNDRERGNAGRPDNNRPDTNRPGNNRLENNVPENRAPLAGSPQTPNNPTPGATPPNNPAPPERNRGVERPQQLQQQAPQVTPPVQPPQSEDRNNRNGPRDFQRPQQQAPERPAAQAAPERHAPQIAPERPTPPPVQPQAAPAPNPPPTEDRGNRDRDRNFQRGPAATEQRSEPQRPAMPERATPPSPPQRPAMEQRTPPTPATPPTPPPAQQPQRPPEAARGGNRDQGNRDQGNRDPGDRDRNNRGNDNR